MGDIDSTHVRPAVLRAAAASAATVMAIGTLLSAPVAAAAPCPDVEVVFARGTTETPGVGGIGQAFVDAVRAAAGERSVGVYAVDYPASTDFPTAAQGVVDASEHVRSTAATCPATKMVLGGFSQGAAVIGYITADAIPDGYAVPAGITGPLPPEVADRVSAVALFGKPSNVFLAAIDAPPIAIGGPYVAKTMDLCASGDPICTPGGDNRSAHNSYAANGMVGRAAGFAASRL